MATVDGHSPDFDTHNLFYLAVMGLISSVERFDDLLAQQGPTRDAPPAADPRAVQDDPVLCFVLGLIALRDDARRHLAAARRPAPPATAPRSNDERLTLRELLR